MCFAKDCPSSAEGEDLEQPSQSGGKAKRLPREVKMRLAKVARLAVRSTETLVLSLLSGLLADLMVLFELWLFAFFPVSLIRFYFE